MEGAAADIVGTQQPPRGPQAWLAVGKEAVVPYLGKGLKQVTLDYDVRVLAHRGGKRPVLSRGGKQQGRGGATPFEVQINWADMDKGVRNCEEKGAWRVEESSWGMDALLDPVKREAEQQAANKAKAEFKKVEKRRARGDSDPAEAPSAKRKEKAKLKDDTREDQGRARGAEKALLATKVKKVKMRGKGLPSSPQQRVLDVAVQSFARQDKFLDQILENDRLSNATGECASGGG